MEEKMTNIGGRLHDASMKHTVAGANEIMDDNLEKKQDFINAEQKETNMRQSAINREVDNHFEEQEIKINNRYTKEETNNLISRTPETDVIVMDIPSESQSDIAAYLDANTPAEGRANKLYRVPGPDNTTFSEWAWDGTKYIMLANKDYGIDAFPKFGSGNSVNSEGLAKYINPWLESAGTYGDPSVQTNDEKVSEVLKAVVDVWASDITDTPASGNGSWYDGNYKLKVGFFGFDSNSLALSSKFWLFFHFTDGTNYKTSSVDKIDITNRNGISHIVCDMETFTGSAKIHVLIDFSRLDFSKISTNQIGNYYYFITGGILTTEGVFVTKKVGTEYNNIIVNNNFKNNSTNIPTCGGVSSYIKSNPNKWFAGSEDEIALFDASKRSIMDAIVDVWFETEDSQFQQNGYYIKCNAFSVDANRLSDIRKLYMQFLLTDGTLSTKFFNGFVKIDNPIEVQHVRFEGVPGWAEPIGAVDVVIDLTKLDFSTFPENPDSTYGYKLIDDTIEKNGYLVTQKKTSEYSLSANTSDWIKNNKDAGETVDKLYIPWVSRVGNRVTIGSNDALATIKKSIVDIWTTDITDNENSGEGSWYDSNYELKIGALGFNATTLEESTEVWFFVHFTDGENIKTSASSQDGWGKENISGMKNGIIHIERVLETMTGRTVVHCLLDVTMLDFSQIDQTPYNNFYFFTSVGADPTIGIFINKKESTKYCLPTINDSLYLHYTIGDLNRYDGFLKELYVGNVSGVDLSNAVKVNMARAYHMGDIWWTGVIIEQNVTNNISIYKTYNSEEAALSDDVQIITLGNNSAIFDLSKIKTGTLVSVNTILSKNVLNPRFSPVIYNEVLHGGGSIDNNPYPTYKLNMVGKMLCAGDSLTEGFVVEGSEDNPQTIFEVMTSQSWPVRFKQIHPHINIDTKAVSGITCTGWYNTFYNNTDFSQYDLMVFELGLNGYLRYEDIDVEGTNTNDYRKIIKGARAQNPNAVIALYRAQHFSDNWMPILEFFAQESNCIIIDGKDSKYLNLDSPTYHGWCTTYSPDGNPYIDWAHFTRKGYNALAYFISRHLGDLISDETLYNQQ